MLSAIELTEIGALYQLLMRRAHRCGVRWAIPGMELSTITCRTTLPDQWRTVRG